MVLFCFQFNKVGPSNLPPLVFGLVDIVGASVESQGFVVTVEVASAGLDHHHILAESLSTFTAEADRHCLGLLWATAASVQAGPAVPGPEPLYTAAACIGQPHRLPGSLSVAALLTLLLMEGEQELCDNTFSVCGHECVKR